MKTVAIEKCRNYEEKNVYESVKNLVDLLGGWEAFIRPGSKVVIKPNLAMYKKPDDAVTTHPSIVKAVVSQVQKAGGVVTIAESPGGPYNHAMLRYVYKMTGIEQVANETGAILNYDLRVKSIQNTQAKYMKRMEVIKPLLEADIIINLPKLKTHTMMVFTGAVKNMFGAIAGTAKADLHLRMPDYNQFADSLIDIYLSVKPTINIMDAVTGMEGYGPTSGNPRDIGVVMASEDGFALDSTAMKLIQLPLEKVPVIKQGKDRNLTDENIQVVGEELEKIKVKDYDIPALYEAERYSRLDTGLFRLLKGWLRPRPVINRAKCVRCGNCVKNCPPKVITMEKDKEPVIDYQNCIRCFCCHEFCGHHAIDIHRSWVSKVMLNRKISGFLQK